MPLPGSEREKRLLQEINKPVPVVEEVSQPQFLQEIKEPNHEELIVEETPKRRRRSKKS